MKIKYVRADVREEINAYKWSEPDYRQAECVLKFRPDIVIKESPMDKTPDTIYNKFSCKDKPFNLVAEHRKYLIKNSKVVGNGDALSDVKLIDNIASLWKEGHDVLIYNVDAPNVFRKEFFEVWKYMYPSALKNWLWWVRIYIREKYMAKNIAWILEKHKDKEKVTIAIFLQNWHWRHVKFLMGNPTKNEIWKYYFARFKEVNQKNITEKIKKENKVFYKYWMKMSDFA